MFKTSEFRDFSKSNPSRLAQMIENPFRNFSASKHSQAVKPMTVVEYKDFFGKVYRIPVRNKTQMREAQLFLSIFKSEMATLKSILSEYPVSYGRIPKKFMKELRTELKPLGFSNELINKVAGY